MSNHPPKLALRILRWFCREDFIEEIEGNLLEIFESQFEGESRWSTLWFYWQVVSHFRPDFIKPNPLMTLFSRSLLRHNLLISYRSFLRNKRSFFINLTGLSTGLACVLLIYLWVADEWQYDRFHEKDQHLYRVLQNHTSPNGINTWKNTPVPLADALETEVSGIAEAISISSKEESPRGVLMNGDNTSISSGIFAGPSFFDVFSFPLKEGSIEQVLSRKDAVVLSEKTARKLFPGDQAVLGKAIKWRDQALEVTGIFKNVPSYSSLQFDFVLHIDLMTDRDEYAGQWNGDYARNYVLLNDYSEAEKISKELGDFMKTGVAQRKRSTLFLQPYSDQYLHGNFRDGFLAGGRISYVKLFSITAIFILLIACFNFMNLSTAQAGLKMKEIGVKKTMGAQKHVLVGQFLTESLLMTFLSLFMALCLVVFLIPYFNQLTGKSLGLVLGWETIGVILGIVLLTGLVAGSYPAFYLSRFQPKAVLTSDWQGAAGGAWLRKSLVVLQFSLSVLFMVSVFIVNGQLKFIQDKHLGFNRDNVIQFNRNAFTGDFKTFLQELGKIPGVADVANMATPILAGGGAQSGYSWRGQEEDKKYLFKSPIISYNVIETLEMELLAGRTYSTAYGDEENKIIINESARQMMGLEDPIGMQIDYGDNKREIIGVVDDFHYGSIHQAVKPLIFRMYPRGRRVIVRLESGKEKEALAQIETLYEKHHPPYPFKYGFLDEEYQRLHESESKVASLSTYFTGLAILISTLGILGLAMFMAEQRSKEIGVRKVLGATDWNIIQLLGSSFTRLIILGVIIALPISYWGAQKWLGQFAYHMDLKWWLFLAAALITILIASIAVLIQAWKAVNVSPAVCLRNE